MVQLTRMKSQVEGCGKVPVFLDKYLKGDGVE